MIETIAPGRKRTAAIWALCGLVIGLALPPAAAQTPTAIEAVEYDAAGNRWLVSNGSSILSTAGPGAPWSYFGNAQASHGMEVVDGMLVAIGNNVMRAYELESGALLGSLALPGATFLNGMGAVPGGVVVSDFGNGRIHRVDWSDPANPQATLLATLPGSPNGVAIDPLDDRAVVVMWGPNADIVAVDLETGATSLLVDGTGLGNLDGIDHDSDGNFYVSSWSPARITRFPNDFSSAETVVSQGLSSPADISYALDRDTLAVANSGSDAVTWHSFAEVINGVDGEVFAGQTTAKWTGSAFQLRCAAAGVWHFEAFTSDGRLLASDRWWLPGAEVGVERNRLPAALQLAESGGLDVFVWRLQAPDGAVFSGRGVH